MNSFFDLIPASLVVAVALVAAAIPWVWSLDSRPFKQWINNTTVLGYLLGAVGAITIGLAYWMNSVVEVKLVEDRGYVFASILHFELILDLFVALRYLPVAISPKGGAVAVAAMREAIRQPMYWLIMIGSALLILLFMYVPYFTLGDDYTLYKLVAFDVILLFPGLFGLLVASITINEEIEGRTAITVISKPISRRQFFIGKYIGLLMACLTMALVLTWVLTYALNYKLTAEPLDESSDLLMQKMSDQVSPHVAQALPDVKGNSLGKGMGVWMGETFAHHMGTIRLFGQVMVLLAICTTLATRMHFVINLVICLGIYLMGNLAPIILHATRTQENDGTGMQLINFIARLFDAVFPSLNSFGMGPAIVRDSPLEPMQFLVFVATVLFYGVLYSGIALLLGLFLFEDRDLS
ncbi:MAG: ABC transporter permease [Zavarzinella sp.]